MFSVVVAVFFLGLLDSFFIKILCFKAAADIELIADRFDFNLEVVATLISD